MIRPSAGERVLEVGPGTGYYTLDVADWVGPDGAVEILDVQRQVSGRLHGVRVDRYSASVGNADHVADRLDGSDLVVGVHHADQRRLVRNGPFQMVEIDSPLLVDFDLGHLEAAEPGQPPTGIQDGMVLDAAGDEVAFASECRGLRHALDRQVRSFAT